MTQREFWTEIESRTSKEVADMGFDSVTETDLPGVSRDEAADDPQDALTCADLDAAARAMQQMYDDHKAALACIAAEEQRMAELDPLPPLEDIDLGQFITPLSDLLPAEQREYGYRFRSHTGQEYQWAGDRGWYAFGEDGGMHPSLGPQEEK